MPREKTYKVKLKTHAGGHISALTGKPVKPGQTCEITEGELQSFRDKFEGAPAEAETPAPAPPPPSVPRTTVEAAARRFES